MNEDIEKLTFAKMEADKSRDVALKENETLKFSLGEKDTLLKEQITALADKDAKLKFYQDAEVAAAAKLKEDQWAIVKFSIPAGKIHKPEDHDALKAEFINDPAGFAVKLVSFAKEDPRGESGAEFTSDSEKSGAITGIYTPGKGYEV